MDDKPIRLDQLNNETLGSLRWAEGIYAYLDSKRKILYIGRSKDLGERIRYHHSKQGIEKMLPDATYIFIHLCDNSRELEKRLIWKYEPSYNRKGLTSSEGLSI